MPDKEFRYLRTVIVTAAVYWDFDHDKEFRYLRTVIVTAAVYWDFDQELSPHHLIFQHRAGITPYTSTFVFAECCVFNKQLQPPIL